MNRVLQNNSTLRALIQAAIGKARVARRSGLAQSSSSTVRGVFGVFIALSLGMLMPLFLGCQGPGLGSGDQASQEERKRERQIITVFAAASLREAFSELTYNYEQEYPGQSVRLNFDGSQRLRTQLEHGAQADVFASADWFQMGELAKAGMLVGRPVSFASNQPVFLVNAKFLEDPPGGRARLSSASDLAFKSISGLLARPGVKIVAASHEVPAGRYSQVVLDNIGASPEYGPQLAHNISANIVSRETNVRGVAQKVALGEADAGLTYRTDARPDFISRRVSVVKIPDSINVSAHYPVAALTDREPATTFIEFLLSADGKKTLQEHGFGPPDSAQGYNR